MVHLLVFAQILCHVPEADEAVVEAAVEAAEEGFKVWSKMSGFERGKVLAAAAQLLEDSHPELARSLLHRAHPLH